MANKKSAAKRARQSDRRRLRNKMVRTRLRTAIKKVRQAIEKKSSEDAVAAYRVAQKLLDQAVNKGIVKANTAARNKSRLSKHILSIQA